MLPVHHACVLLVEVEMGRTWGARTIEVFLKTASYSGWPSEDPRDHSQLLVCGLTGPGQHYQNRTAARGSVGMDNSGRLGERQLFHLELYLVLVLPVRPQRGFTQSTVPLGFPSADPFFFLYGDVKCGPAKVTDGPNATVWNGRPRRQRHRSECTRTLAQTINSDRNAANCS